MYGSREQGFTLIELMVVVLIITILVAIAIPTFLGLRARAQDRSAQADLRNGLTAARAHRTDGDTFSGFNAAVAETIEPALTWVGNGGGGGGGGGNTPPGIGEVKVQISAGANLLLVTRSSTQTFFCIGQRNPGEQIIRGSDASFTNVDAVNDCVQGW